MNARRVAAWSTLAVCLTAAILITPTYVAGWGPVFHIVCVRGTFVASEQNFAPAVVANSPFGGWVWDNGTLPANLPGTPGYPTSGSALDAPAWNGTSAGAFFFTNVSIYSARNLTVLGTGADLECGSRYITAFQVPSITGGEAFEFIPKPTNLSDLNESDSGVPPGHTFLFENGFAHGNQANVSTCGGPAESIRIGAPSFTMWVPVPALGVSVPVTPPINVSFHYLFPADFGIWQIDNLSAPGGPGGGWAFSYSPCP